MRFNQFTPIRDTRRLRILDVLLAALVVVTALLLPRSAFAQQPALQPAVAECRAGNLLARARVIEPKGVTAPVLTDGAVVPEGSPWPPSEVLFKVHGPLTLDAGAVMPLRVLQVQVDADLAAKLEISSDGQTWHSMQLDALPSATGMTTRVVGFSALPFRYVRLTAADDSQTMVLTEMRALCEVPADLTQGLHLVGAVDVDSDSLLPVVSPRGVTVAKLVVAIAGLLWLVWFIRSRATRSATCPAKQRKRWRRLRDATLVSLALFSTAAYFHFGAYRYPDFIHQHDVFHYFVGAKYFPELGYRWIYDCSAVAELEAGFAQRVAARGQRDLGTNRIISGTAAAQNGAECRRRFSPERWAEFSRDVAYFANARNVHGWHNILHDHGFNATPTWIAAGSAVARFIPASEQTVGSGSAMFHGWIGPIDPLLLLVAALAIGWAFGWRAAMLAVIVFGANCLAGFSWVGGAYMRQPWLVALVVGVCLLRKRQWIAAGIVMAFASMLQLIPAACVFGAGLALLVWWWRERKIDWGGVRFLAAAAVTVALLVPLSAWVCGAGVLETWSAFISNTVKHTATPAGNLTGLPAALSFRWSTRNAVLFDPAQVDPFAATRAARAEALRLMRPVQIAAVAVGVLALIRAAKHHRDLWVAACLGLALVPLALSNSCYYLSFVAVLALLVCHRPSWGLPIMAMLIGWALGALWIDEGDVYYAAASWWLAICLAWALWIVGRREQPAAAAPAPEPRPEPFPEAE